MTASGDRSLGGEALLELIETKLGRQPAVPQQVDHLFKSRVVRESVYIETLVRQNARVAIDKTNLGFRCDNAFQPSSIDGHS